MAVVKLKEVSIIGKLADLDNIATICGRTEVFHVEDAMSRYTDSPDFVPFSDENPYSEALSAMQDAVSRAGKELTLLEGKEAEKIDLTSEAAISYAQSMAATLREWEATKTTAQAKYQEYSDSMEAMGHFVGLNLDLDEIAACEYVNVRFGSLPKENLDKLDAYKENTGVIFVPCTEDATHQWGLCFVPSPDANNAMELSEEETRPIDAGEVDRIFAGIGFQKVLLETMKGRPEDTVADLRSKKEAEEAILKQAESNIDSYWNEEAAKAQVVYTYLAEKNVYFSAICRNAVKYDDNFVLIGWIPKEAEAPLSGQLQQYDLIELNFRGGKEVEKYNPPRTIKNIGIFRPYEMYTKMFGTPGPNDIDPTPLVAIVYSILFGIMFGDVGQGAVIGIVAFILYKKGKLAVGAILVPCCICSVIFGFFYGSIFGVETWLNPVHQAMSIDFNAHAGKFIEVMDAYTSPYIIYFTMGIGVVIMTICMIINIINKFAKGHAGEAVFGTSGIAGLAFYIGLAGVLANLIVADLCTYMGFNFFSLGWLLGMCLAPLVLIFFREPLGMLIEGKGIHFEDGFGNYCLQNIFELIEVAISTMSNVMSFLRVGAFVLVHAGMMQVVFSLAETFGGSNMIIYIIIAVIGNALIAVLECLLVCIQVLRLNFYEMFNRFYVGDGREYIPVVASKMINTEG